VACSEEIDRLVETWTIEHTPEEVMTMMQAAGVGAGVVANARDLYEDVQLKHYNYFREVDHPYMGKIKYAHPPALKMSDVDSEVWRSSILGEHNEYVCQEILGMSDTEYGQLVEAKVFE
jgi:benzylsuccinate CoA-transferase BbsF subunit